MQNKLAFELLDFLRRIIYQYGSAGGCFAELSIEQQKKILQGAEEQHLEAFLFYALSDVLPEHQKELYKKRYQKNSIVMLKNKAVLAELCRLFEKENIRFAPFKGADLAYRCYPVPAVRYMSDIDILIHPDDCRRALELLAQNHWQPERPVDLKTPHHHYSQHFKNGVCLEPHWTFAQFGQVDPLQIWQYIQPLSSGSMQHKLSCELNLLQLTCHAASWHYNHLLPVKLLLDAAFLIQKEMPDWKKLRVMSKQWHLPYPGDLLSAYPELFSGADLQAMQGDAAAAAAYRELLENSFSSDDISPGEFDLYDERGGLFYGVTRGIKRMNAAAIRKKYSLPEHGAYCRLGICWGMDLIRKFFRFIHYAVCPSKKMKKRRQLIKQAERIHGEK